MSLRLFMALGAGGLDALTGRHLSMDGMAERLQERIAEFLEQDLYAIRIWKLPASVTLSRTTENRKAGAATRPLMLDI